MKVDIISTKQLKDFEETMKLIFQNINHEMTLLKRDLVALQDRIKILESRSENNIDNFKY